MKTQTNWESKKLENKTEKSLELCEMSANVRKVINKKYFGTLRNVTKIRKVKKRK